MPKCPACDKETQNDWTFCPTCGAGLTILAASTTYPSYRARCLWEREENGKELYKNFKSVRYAGVFPFTDVENIRQNLTDFAHLNLFQIRTLATFYTAPTFYTELSRIGKLIGYYTVEATLKTTNLDQKIASLRKGTLKEIFGDDNLISALKIGWLKHRTGELVSIEVDEPQKIVRFQVSEPSCSIKASLQNPCILKDFLCGECEAFFEGPFDGKLTKCQHEGDAVCEVEVNFKDQSNTGTPSAESYEKIRTIVDYELNNVVDSIVTKKLAYPRQKLGDSFYLFIHQCLNFLMTALSPGHAVLSKYSGRICGERIAEKAGLSGQDSALAYLEDLFLYLKAGIIRSEKAGDRVIIRMKESVYASGVNNIHQNLCIFLAGIIEGALNKATGQKWDVSEMKCLASGFPECEFWCKKI